MVQKLLRSANRAAEGGIQCGIHLLSLPCARHFGGCVRERDSEEDEEELQAGQSCS